MQPLPHLESIVDQQEKITHFRFFAVKKKISPRTPESSGNLGLNLPSPHELI